MKPMTGAAVAIALALMAAPLAAQVFHSGNGSIQGNLCVGWSCTASESFGLNDTLKLKYENNAILFDDSSTGAGYANGDWRLRANDSALNGASFFALEDADAGVTVLRIDDASRPSALHIDAAGLVGLGTSLPGASLHMVSGASPSLRFDQDGSGGNTPQAWQLAGDDTGFRLFDLTAATAPLIVLPADPPADSVVIDGRAWLGIGYGLPTAPLHILKNTGSAKLRVEETAAATTPRNMLELVNNGRPEITMANTSTGGEWSFGAGTNFILKQGAVGSAGSAKTKLFEIGPTGDATLTGSLTTGGTTCGGGCDAVFDPSYDLPAIADYAAQTRAQGYLPHVGPTPEGAPFNVTQKLGGMLNALEHAHLYIAGLEADNVALKARVAAQEQRIEALERAIVAQPRPASP